MVDGLTISNLDAARRRLETAIRLYLEEHDPVSIHTRASAALQIIRKVNEANGKKPLFREAEFLESFKPEARKAVIEKLNETANSFKHADRDPTGSKQFNGVQARSVGNRNDGSISMVRGGQWANSRDFQCLPRLI